MIPGHTAKYCSYTTLAFAAYVVSGHGVAVFVHGTCVVSWCVFSVTTYLGVTGVGGWVSQAGKICSWNLQSGEPIMEFAQAHKGASVTSMCHGHDGRRFVSGASDGSVYVWNIHSGQILQELVKQNPKEVTGVTYAQDSIYTVGWDGQLCSYWDGQEVKVSTGTLRVPVASFADCMHNDDITSMDFAAPTFIATGSYDGHIIFWNINTMCVCKGDSVRVVPSCA